MTEEYEDTDEQEERDETVMEVEDARRGDTASREEECPLLLACTSGSSSDAFGASEGSTVFFFVCFLVEGEAEAALSENVPVEREVAEDTDGSLELLDPPGLRALPLRFLELFLFFSSDFGADFPRDAFG